MKYITESVQNDIVASSVSAVLLGDLKLEDCSESLRKYANENDIGVYSNRDIVESIRIALDVVSTLSESDFDTESPSETAINNSIQEHIVDKNLSERQVKSISFASKKAGGALVSKKKDRVTRSRRAVQTTGLSKASMKKRAKKAAKTLRRKPASQKNKSNKLRKKSLKKRKSLGI